ncbi:hypothetical protein [Pantoea sp. PNT03]|uniref:hypothetical protein n=1 Tax=Pantoea sp. PNT03 TaxID=2769258 RepID=UPI001785C483|nr:hypothetical protein [Pantoea sp. PNT03]MBD9658089.1 hypothetical protein [Pantoea sp. PNT03]
MNKLTAEVARRDIVHLKSFQSDPKVGLSLKEEKYLQALEIALPVLEQQQVLSVPAYYIVYHPNPDPNEYDDKEHSHCGSIHLARRLATEIGGTICPVYFGEQEQPTTDTYRQIENDEDRGDDEAFWDADYD